MNRFVLSFELIDSPLLAVCAIVAGLGVVAIVLWAPRRLITTTAIGIGAALVMYVVAHVLESMDVFEGPLPVGAASKAAVAVGAAAVGVVGICRRPWTRRIIGLVTVIASLLAGALALLGGLNAILVLQVRRRFSGWAIAVWAALYLAFVAYVVAA